MASTTARASRAVRMVAVAVLVTSALVAVAAPADAARRPTPRALRTTATDQTSITVRWHGVARAPGYRVRWSVHRSMAGSHRLAAARPRVRIDGLAADTRYYVQVAVAARHGRGRLLSRWSRVLVRRTPPPPCPTTRDLGDPTPAAATGRPTDLRVASYNIRSMSLDAADHPEQRWANRADRVAGLLLGAATSRNPATAPPDVIALQEADLAYGRFAVRCTNQLTDLRDRLNAAGVGHYEATSLSPSSSVDTRILFDTTHLRLESAGAVLLVPPTVTTTHPYLSWAVFQARDGGQRFFFADVHLVPHENADSRAVRDAEWDQLLARLADPTLTQGLPVVLGGDFNSPRNGTLNTSGRTHLPLMYAAGVGDTLLGGQDPGDTTLSTTAARAQPNTNAECASLTNFVPTEQCAPPGTIGQQIDYLFASNDLPVRDWQLVLDTDDQGTWTGTMPSDHDLVRATVTLPAVTG